MHDFLLIFRVKTGLLHCTTLNLILHRTVYMISRNWNNALHSHLATCCGLGPDIKHDKFLLCATMNFYFFFCAVPFYMWIWVTDLYHFPSQWRIAFNISCRINLLTIDSFSYFMRKIFDSLLWHIFKLIISFLCCIKSLEDLSKSIIHLRHSAFICGISFSLFPSLCFHYSSLKCCLLCPLELLIY